MAFGRRPLQTYTHFLDVVQHDNYCGPTLDIEWPEHFPNDNVLGKFVKGKAIGICGPYLDKEEEAKLGLTKVHKLCI